MTRRLLPSDFFGLTPTEAEAFRVSGMTRQQWDRSRLLCAHGDMATGLMHLRSAEAYFRQAKPEVAAALAPLLTQLSKMTPSYQQMEQILGRRYRPRQEV